MSIKIRELEEKDKPEWEVLWAGYLEFYNQDIPAGVTQTTWSRLLDPDVDIHGLCSIADDGALTGIVHFLYHPVTWAVEPRCYLEDLFVAESARGTGAGRKLIEAVYAAADSRGCDQVYWLTQEDNATARTLYDRVARKTDFIKYVR